MSRCKVEELEQEIMQVLDGEQFAQGMTALTKCITNVMAQTCDTQDDAEDFMGRLNSNINALWAECGPLVTRH